MIWLTQYFAKSPGMHALIDFFFPKRLHRLAYFIRLMASNLCLALLLGSSSPNGQPYPLVGVILLALYSLFFILLPRLRDTGMSGWWVILSLVPIVYVFLGIILLFRAPAYHFDHAVDEGDAET